MSHAILADALRRLPDDRLASFLRSLVDEKLVQLIIDLELGKVGEESQPVDLKLDTNDDSTLRANTIAKLRAAEKRPPFLPVDPKSKQHRRSKTQVGKRQLGTNDVVLKAMTHEWVRPRDIEAVTDLGANQTRHALYRLRDEGKVEHNGRTQTASRWRLAWTQGKSQKANHHRDTKPAKKTSAADSNDEEEAGIPGDQPAPFELEPIAGTLKPAAPRKRETPKPVKREVTERPKRPPRTPALAEDEPTIPTIGDGLEGKIGELLEEPKPRTPLEVVRAPRVQENDREKFGRQLGPTTIVFPVSGKRSVERSIDTQPVRLVVVKVEELASGDDRFDCKPLQAKLKAADCVGRQVSANKKIASGSSTKTNAERIERNMFAASKCQRCELGAKVSARLEEIAR